MDNRITMWWPLAKSLAAFLNTQIIEEGLSIYPGTKGTGKKYPSMEITWDDETGIFIQKPTTSNVKLWVDIALKCNSSDPAQAYDLQDIYQNKVLCAIKEWPEQVLNELGIASKVSIPDIISDGDIDRPTSTSRIVVKIEWRNS